MSWQQQLGSRLPAPLRSSEKFAAQDGHDFFQMLIPLRRNVAHYDKRIKFSGDFVFLI